MEWLPACQISIGRQQQTSHPIPGVLDSRYATVDQPGCLCFGRGSVNGSMHRRGFSGQLQFGDSGRNTVRGPHFTDSDIYITKTFKLHEGVRDLPLRHPDVQRLQSCELCAAQQCGGRCAGLDDPDSLWNNAKHHLPAYRSARRRTRGR